MTVWNATFANPYPVAALAAVLPLVQPAISPLGDGATALRQAAQAACQAQPLPSVLASPNGRFVAKTAVVDAGLRRVTVNLAHDGEPIAVFTDDITSAAWTPDDRGLVFAVAGVYGVPGVYVIDTRFGTLRRIGSDLNTSDPSYPAGADWFAVCEVRSTGDDGYLVQFLHSPHVDSLASGRMPTRPESRRFSLPGM